MRDGELVVSMHLTRGATRHAADQRSKELAHAGLRGRRVQVRPLWWHLPPYRVVEK